MLLFVVIFFLSLPFMVAGLFLVVVALRSKAYRKFAIIALNIPLAFLLWGIVLNKIPDGIYGAINPFATVALLRATIGYFVEFNDFASSFALPALVISLVVTILAVIWKRTRYGFIVVFAMCFLFLVFMLGERASQRLMCEKANAVGVSRVLRNSFPWSLKYNTSWFQDKFHAEIQQDGKRYAWSYRALDWFEVDDRLSADIEASGSVYDCVEQ